MSHMTLEYSGNLREDGRFFELCGKLARYMVELQVNGVSIFPPGGVRVRAVACDEFYIADGSLPDATFVHAILKIGAGRSEAAKKAMCDGSFEIMKTHFADMFSHRPLALSLEFHEFSESGTLKYSNLHARLKQQQPV